MKRLLLGYLVITLLVIFSCHNDPFIEYGQLESSLRTLETLTKKLDKKHLSPEEMALYLGQVEDILPELQEGRDRMAEKIDQLTKESFEINSSQIESLKGGRLDLYRGMDDFLVQTYILWDLIKKQTFYNQRDALKHQLRSLQLSTTAMVQKDPPFSKVSFSYYKNLPEMTSQTADEEGGWFYTLEVNIGYNYNEKNTQTIINNSKVALSGEVRSYFSGLTKDYVMGTDESIIKAGLVLRMNDYLIQFTDFSDNKMEGVKLVTFDILQFYEFH